ncbi:hypothetical protein BMF94_4349 [Rhodotorula taiwanensis]|uniref:Uncharacterized protein n=1 Tax=Rhodotorula taiwanensis TaxID=741276 RepID=A0A2S5B6W8_9BASI|nr:hypothetical protein BMF94_4349 [Rhodotorula taiwanensis]
MDVETARLPSLEPSLSDDVESNPLGSQSRAATRILPLRRTRSAVPQSHAAGADASPSPARTGDALPVLADDGLASPPSPANRELRTRTRPAIVQQPSTRRSARVPGEGGGGSTAPATPRLSTPLGRRRTFNGLETLAVVREDVAEAAPSRPMTPLTRSRSEAGIDASGSTSSPASPHASEQVSRRLRRRRTSGDATLSPSLSSAGSLQTRSASRKGLR